jgi:List-Bact-rpt repeat protein
MSRFRRLATLTAVGLLLILPTVPSATADGPTIIASDDFNRADETPISTSGNWGRVIAGNYDGESHLVNNEITSVSNEGIYYWKGAGTFNPTRQFARQRVVQDDGELGLVLLGGPDHAIMMQWGPPGVGNTLYIYWYKDGQDQAVLSQTPATINNGDIIEGVLDGGVIYAKVNGAVVASVANTTTLTTGNPGFITYLNPGLPTQVSKLDDWEAGTPASYTISGTITENAAGLSGVTVTAAGGFTGTTTTDSNGNYSFSSVPGGIASMTLTPSLSGHEMSPSNRTVNGPLTADVPGQDFTSTPITDPTLTVNATHGAVIKNPDLPSYTLGQIVTLTPVPDANYTFSGWSGDVPVGDELDNPLQLTMDHHREVTAHFLAQGVIASDHFNRADETPLDVVNGPWQKALAGGAANLSGNQVVGASSDAVYFWNGTGTFSNSRQYARATVVQAGGQVGLVLLSGPGQAYVVSWGGGRLFFYWYNGSSYQGELANVAAPLQNGDEIEAVLDQGRVFARRNGVLVHSMANTTSLTTGKPGFEMFQTGQALDDWEAGTPPTVTISGTITESAVGLSGVTVTSTGSFSGTTTTDSNGNYSFSSVPFGVTSITLTPTLGGYAFTPANRTVTGPLSADVTGQDFTASTNTDVVLTTNATNGTVTRNPDLPVYTLGAVVTLTPVPNAGYAFTGWTGDVPVGDELDNPLQVTMDQDRTITAHFVAQGATASDDFNRANETPFAVGGNWQQVLGGGSANLSGNQVVGASGEGAYFWNGAGTFSNTRQYARATAVQAGGQVGLVVLGGPGHAAVVAWAGGRLIFYWYNGGSYQGELANIAAPLQNGDEIEAVLDQGRIFAKRNGAVIHSVAKPGGLTTGTPGFEMFQTGQALDDWGAGTPPTVTISGTITESAVGLSGVTVTSTGSFSGTTTTDSNGNYAFASVPFGVTSITLTPTLSGYAFTPSNRTVTGPLSADVTGQDFTASTSTDVVLTTNATNGTVTRNPDLPVYTLGAVVTLTPVPNAGYAFSGWTGDVPVGDELDNPLQVTMDQDRTITAHFVAQGATASDDFNRANETPLTVGGNWQQVLGGGSANLSGNQVVDASGEAVYFWNGAGTFSNTRQYARATAVQTGGQLGLVVLGGPGHAAVVAWAGGQLIFYWYNGGSYQGELANIAAPLQNGDEIEAVLDQGRIFAKRNGVVVHSVAKPGGLTTGTPGFETFLTGQALDNWQAGTPPTVTISGTITENAVGLSGVTVTSAGSFSGTTTTDSNGNYAFASVPFGVTSVTLTPTLSGYAFTPSNRTVTGPLSADVTGQDFTATGATEATLTVNAIHGTVTKNPDLTVYPIGSNVTLTPVPDPGYRFAGWSGDVPPGDETDNPLVLTMSQDRTVTALFASNDAAAWDHFNRANETPFAVGGNWIQPFGGGTSSLISQRVTGGSAEALYFWQGPGAFSTETQFARSTVTQPGGQVGLVLLGSAGRGLVVAWNGGTLFVYWYTGGSYQGNLATFSSTLQVGDRIEALLENGIVYAKINGVVVASVANTTTLPWGRPGFETFQTGQGFDDWEAGPIVTECTGQPDGTPCNDGDSVCTPNDTCQAGVCVGTPLSCDDGNPCTVDSCTPGVGCPGTPGNAGAVCRAAAGQCDVAETCTGASSVCPADVFASSATTCTGASQGGACDAADHCGGTSNTCVDGFEPSTVECRPAIDGCDVAETCTGSSGSCPADGQSPELGTPCDGADSDLCNEGVKVCVEGAIACDDTTGDNLDVCNGADDDCDPASADGSEDPAVGVACDGADSDLCLEGFTVCTAGTIVCGDTTGDNLDVCNGSDDDCDPSSADGSEDPGVGVTCDGADTDLCAEGLTVCVSGGIACSDTTGNNLDVCNGVDDDCDPSSTDGSEDPAVGLGCDGADSDLCNEGVTICSDGGVTCTDNTGSTLDLCNGADDDCDPASEDGSEDPSLGVACDGADSDLCNEGVTVCTGGVPTCSDTTADNLDICNGVDDDCDAASADGSEDPGVGVACDGPDSDLCAEGQTVCVDSAISCNDTSTDNLDLCNGIDDDCDPASADGSEDASLGVACDGADSDLCNEGVTVCTGGAPTCNDTTTDNLDVCNGVDDDCDAASADGSEDPGVGLACDGPDSDLCTEGQTVCIDSSISCNDASTDNLDVCNGVDDDCDPASADGSEDASLGVACDGADSDLCNEGVTVCTAGVPTCNDTTTDNLDVCDGADDDCDPASADGSEDPGVGVACDGPDSDLCTEGLTVCSDSTITCNDTTTDNLDVCNGVDDDCDPASADGSEDASLGVACDGADSDLCNEGVTVCTAGAPTCNDTTTDNLDVCNGADDDCDPASADGSEDPGVGVACDGPDSDLCTEGLTVCSEGTISCTDTTTDNLDVCNGVDDDCDPASADGAEDPGVGLLCDGADSDLCNEGSTVCSGGTVSCSDATGSTLDVCNGVDDDCDPASVDGAEDPTVGVACDGADSDLCNEGLTICSGAAVSCTDLTASSVDLCNGLDDDCDPASADGAEDPLVAIACDGPDSDLCLEGVSSCTAGAVACSDATGSTIETCNGLDDDCDSAVDENGLALCDDGNSCNGAEVCAGATGCQAGPPPTVASRISIPDTITALSGGTLVAPVVADIAAGTAIQLVVTYDPAVVQPLGVDKSLITANALVTPNLSVGGQVQISILAPQPLQGSGALVYVRFQVLGAVGSSATLGLPQASVDGGLVTSCHDPGRADFCATDNLEVTGLTVGGKNNTLVSWTKIPGGPRRYDVASGTLSDLRGDRSPLDASCLADSTQHESVNDARPDPAVGTGFYYLVRMQDTCAKGTYGNSSRGDLRWTAAACP